MKKLFTFLSRANNNSVGIGNLNVSANKSLLAIIAMIVMLMVPSTLKGFTNTTTINFGNAALAAYFQGIGTSGYSANVVMSSTSYSSISGAYVGERIDYKYGTTQSLDISKLAFIYNSSGNGYGNIDADGFYLRRDTGADGKPAGLYNSRWNQKIAILDLKPSDKVTINFTSSSNVSQHGAGINWDHSIGWKSSGETVFISFIGDLIVDVNIGTIIQSIVIEEEVAEYEIQTNSSDNSTQFWFTAPGALTVNDFAIPYMTVSMGSTSDYLVVQGNSESDYTAHMIKPDETETLETDASTNYQPSAGNFYAFKPTGGGTVEVSGSLTGSQTHLFVYNPATNGWEGSNGQFYKETYTSGNFSFTVEKDKIYYICINNQDTNEHSYSYHLHWFKFTPTFRLDELAKLVDLDTDVQSGSITLTKVYGAGSSSNITVKRCTANIDPASVNGRIDASGNLVIDKPTFASGSDEAGTIILNVETSGGYAAFVVTFPYHADYNPAGYTDTDRTYGHIWNFMDPRVSDSNYGNCKIRQTDGTYTTGTATGILSIGQARQDGEDGRPKSQFYEELQNREWTYGWTIKDSSGNYTDPMYKNVWDMEGDNADMIWETEGLWFETGTNLSCLYNENDAAEYEGGTPVQLQEWQTLNADPDRYVGLLADADKKSSFTIPGLKDGDRVLIFMKSGEKSGSDREAIFFNIEGARDAVGTRIVSTDLYGAGGTLWQHSRLEGCYHFIKDGDGPMTFYMVRGAICKLLSIRIYSGKRIDTNRVLRGGDSSLLFLNDEGTAQENAAEGWYQMRFRGKGEQMDAKVIVCSGNLTDENSFATGKFDVNSNKTAVSFKSTVGEFGVFRLRLMDMDFVHDGTGTTNNIPGQGYKYVCDFADRNFTVGYRKKMSYPYTWDFTDMQTYSGTKIANENTKYPETTNPYERLGWDISLWDENGYMVIGNFEDYDDDGDIFSQNKNGFGNQLYADDVIIPETQGLWFYMDDNQPKYNGCMQITSQGLHFINQNLTGGSHDPWWNYKVVVPSVPSNGAVYLRMKRDSRVNDTDYKAGNNGNVLFLNTRFAWGTDSKTSLSESGSPYTVQENGATYSFFKVDDTDDEYIVAVKNTTGETNHLTFTLNGWILEKMSVSEYAKTVNIKGYATESRGRDIDTKLTSYLTGKDFKTYLVGNPNYSDRTLTLTEVSQNSNYVLPAETGCVLFNSTDENVANILADGFHLFVPDMHDTEKTATTTGNMLKANLEATSIPATETVNGTDYTNYILTYKYYKLDKDGKKIDGTLNTDGPEIFYRVAYGGATGKTNTAYLPLPTASVDPSLATNVQNPAKFTFIFADELFGQSQGITTAIDDASQLNDNGQLTIDNAEWYNMNGQKLNGKPTASGLYIINGKKVLVK